MRSAVNFCIYCQRACLVFTLHRYVLIRTNNFHFDFETHTHTHAHMLKGKRSQQAVETMKRTSQKAMNLTATATAIQSSQMIHCLFVHVCRAISLKPTKTIERETNERTYVRTTIRWFVFVSVIRSRLFVRAPSFVCPTTREWEWEWDGVGLKCKCVTIVCAFVAFTRISNEKYEASTHKHTRSNT